jgi:hypothetical protein
MIWLFLCLIFSSIAAGWLARYYSHCVLVFGKWQYFRKLPKMDRETMESDDPFVHVCLTLHLVADKTWNMMATGEIPKYWNGCISVGEMLHKQALEGSWKQDLSGVKLRRANQ